MEMLAKEPTAMGLLAEATPMLVATGVETEDVEPQTEELQGEELQGEVLQIEVPLEGDFPIKESEMLGGEVLEETITELEEVSDGE